ncbi:MAG: glutamate synthase-related protein, partial [Bacillota bacterium]
LVACGCVMTRSCHTNRCPVGVATMDSELRKRFKGKAEHVRNFMLFVAEELRLIMALLGIATVDELVGRVDLLEQNREISFWKTKNLDLNRILLKTDAPDSETRCTISQPSQLEESLDYKLLPEIEPAIETAQKVTVSSPIYNHHRTVGTIISNRIASKYSNEGLPEGTITINFKGSAGQSFGAFAARGLTLNLEGEANDYVGKGLSGGRIVLKPFSGSSYDSSENIITGNVNLYGATGGEYYATGMAGERFAIRNSGALAVVEGIGDHGCEYMTGGRVVVLGPTGLNFGAGMSGGLAYIYDRHGVFDTNCNLEMIDLETVTEEEDILELKTLLQRHLLYTGSKKAASLLENWEESLPFFIKVFPMEYRLSLGKMSREDQAVERALPQVN